MKKIYKIQGMDCDSCAKMIELDLEDIGIDAKCSYPKKELEVEIESREEEKKIVETLKDNGYSIKSI